MSLEDESKQPLNYLPLQGIVLSAVLPFAYLLPTSHRGCFAGITSPNAAARPTRDPWLDGGRVDIPGHWDAESAA
jgi:hypothetical protein